MSSVEAVFCRSAPWRGFARRVVIVIALGAILRYAVDDKLKGVDAKHSAADVRMGELRVRLTGKSLEISHRKPPAYCTALTNSISNPSQAARSAEA